MYYILSKRIKNLFIITGMLLILCMASDLLAEVKVAQIFGDNMLLQRDIPVQIWGWADEGEKVTVSFNGQEQSVTADKNGKWLLKLSPMKANKTPSQLTITGTNKLILKNILIGDVWICSGQSNMQMSLNQVIQGAKEVAEANYPTIRLMTVPRKGSDFLVDDIKVQWYECSPKTSAGFSAAGYFFARKLVKELDVPIGLISANWGGTRIEPWISPEGYRLVPEQKQMSNIIDSNLPTTAEGNIKYQKFMSEMTIWMEKAQIAVAKKENMPAMPLQPGKMNSHQDPTKLFNSIIHPLIPFAIRGVLWYQGESNGGEGMSYFNKTQALIKGWRQLWNQGDFPFYFVQLANWKQPNPHSPAGAFGWARCREAQRKSLTIPNTGMSVTIDIGDPVNIHPKNKQDVGNRLALWALAKEFKKDVVFSGPLYKEMKIEGDKIRIFFDNTGSGLMIAQKTGLEPVVEAKNGKIKFISIMGKDNVWHWADLVIDGDTIVVSCDEVKEPLAVRYCYTMDPTGPFLYNKEGLPASPFKTGKLL